MPTGQFRDKFRHAAKNAAFAHLALWISSCLSTDWVPICAENLLPPRADSTSLFLSSNVVRQHRFARSMFFCLTRVFFKPENPRSLVYTHKGYTRIVVVVNARHFLWISLFYLNKSSTWTLYKAVNDSVLPCCQFWTNFGPVVKANFVHNRYLWICRALSTGLLFCGVKPLLTELASVFRPTRLHWIF
jgi:hypothetical protein